ncbi:hypothetical protein PR048_004074 [Dryococelus australis]|uniref:Uncharacterized protein n=1 Tax=Dryococelus australis TaxID=614101 RepID=A0ABQ9I5B1_9NEOP|nr:hypothetical protein PR048_004074 [Dryococelus australis]
MIKSRKLTLRMLFCDVDLAIVNSWLEYRQDTKTARIPRAQVLDLLYFRMRLTHSLQTVNKLVVASKQGRPSGSAASEPSTKTSKGNAECRPYQEQRMEMVDQFPEYDQTRKRQDARGEGAREKRMCFV